MASGRLMWRSIALWRRSAPILLLALFEYSTLFTPAQTSKQHPAQPAATTRLHKLYREEFSVWAYGGGGHRTPVLADNFTGGPFNPDWPTSIAACLLIQNEHDMNLQESIRYHRYIGIDTFYIRENDEVGVSKELLQPYIDKGIVNYGLLPGPKHPTQTNWYNECAELASEHHAWIAFIDLDEFIVVLKQKKAVTTKNALKDMLASAPLRFASSVSLQWVLFGSGGHVERPADGQLKGFNKCNGKLSRQMKCIGSSYWLHPAAAFQPLHVHQCFFRPGAQSILANLDPLQMWMARLNRTSTERGSTHLAHLSEDMHATWYEELTDDFQAVLFHYVTRNARFFLERKINRRSGTFATNFKKDQDPQEEATLEHYLDSFHAFEHEFGFDGDFPICRQGGPLTDAIREAQNAGWSELHAPAWGNVGASAHVETIPQDWATDAD